MEFGSTTLNYTLKNELAKNKVTLSFSTKNKLSTILKPLPRRSKNLGEKTGVYKLSCDDCPKFYIGQTSRSFRTRFREHLPSSRSTTNSKTRSAYAAHLIDSKHKYSNFEKNVKVLNVCKKGRYLDCVEEFQIYKAVKTEPDNVLNEQVVFKSNILYNTAMGVLDEDSRNRRRPTHTTITTRSAD